MTDQFKLFTAVDHNIFSITTVCNADTCKGITPTYFRSITMFRTALVQIYAISRFTVPLRIPNSILIGTGFNSPIPSEILPWYWGVG